MMNVNQPICAPPLPNVLTGQRKVFRSSYGDVVYSVSGSGEPLLLVHGINLGSSAFEWRNNVSALDRCACVYALDLVGFGMSEKRPIIYTAEVYKSVIQEFIEMVIRRPVHILASGLAAAYCSGIAFEAPQWIQSLILVTPAGIGVNEHEPNETSLAVYRLFTSPVQGDALYHAFASKNSIQYYLTEFVYANPANVTADTVNYLFNAAHQYPNPQYAPASYIAGMSNYSMVPFFSEIHQPLLLIWGKKAKMGSYFYLDRFIELNPGCQYYVFKDSAVNPQAEEYVAFNRLVLSFLENMMDS
jgi:pimeloyl-ACP methyl ester carboxylesterase